MLICCIGEAVLASTMYPTPVSVYAPPMRHQPNRGPPSLVVYRNLHRLARNIQTTERRSTNMAARNSSFVFAPQMPTCKCPPSIGTPCDKRQVMQRPNAFCQTGGDSYIRSHQFVLICTCQGKECALRRRSICCLSDESRRSLPDIVLVNVHKVGEKMNLTFSGMAGMVSGSHIWRGAGRLFGWARFGFNSVFSK